MIDPEVAERSVAWLVSSGEQEESETVLTQSFELPGGSHSCCVSIEKDFGAEPWVECRLSNIRLGGIMLDRFIDCIIYQPR